MIVEKLFSLSSLALASSLRAVSLWSPKPSLRIAAKLIPLRIASLNADKVNRRTAIHLISWKITNWIYKPIIRYTTRCTI